ncbi:hypothetical protein TIFTF001_029489 [Ficus carica]|uniref:Uncharacterized protein n=1 Tax=Ficus carica TaxID=3494 RepID=A0AA88J2X3_FICCA|nr:hypothetical protein TIFTF001_029489 [Ficus carica]
MTRITTGETVNVRGSINSVFDCLGRPGTGRQRFRDHSIDKPVGAVDPPLTPAIMASPYPTRFKMPSMASYDGSTDTDEHLENYQAHMLIQNANEAALCKAFCLTLTGAARQ